MRQVARVFFVMLGIIGTLNLAVAPSVSAACNDRILTFPAWYRGLQDGSCNLKTPTQDRDGTSMRTFITRIILNIIDILMQLVAYASIVFIIVGGFRYLTSAGAADQMSAAKSTILHAIIGLIIALLAVAIVNLVGASL